MIPYGMRVPVVVWRVANCYTLVTYLLTYLLKRRSHVSQDILLPVTRFGFEAELCSQHMN